MTEDADNAQTLAFWQAPIAVTDPVDPAVAGDMAHELERLANFLPTLCWLAYADGAIFWYNRRWHDYCGTTPEDMVGWGWQSVHDPNILPDVMERWTAAIAGGKTFEMTFPLRGEDGVFRTFLTRASPIRDAGNRVVRWLGTNTEIGAQVRAEEALLLTAAKYEVLTNAMPQMVWSTLPDGFHDYYNDKWYEFTGVRYGSTDGEGWNGMFHPDDQQRAWDRWRHCLATGELYEIEYRLRHHSGEYRWVLGRAQPVRSEDGSIARWIGTCTDIDEAKRAAEHNALLSKELSHRIKNIFAVISGIVSLTASRASEAKPVLTSLLGRIGALGRAHEFARPHSPASARSAAPGSLQGLLYELLLPYEDAEGGRISVEGDDIQIDDRSATPIALVAHELATNSAKYGSLSSAVGRLTIDIRTRGDNLTIRWEENGGPAITKVPTRRGFGTELAELSINRQLGGEINKQWRREGLIVTIALDASKVHRTD